MDDLQQEIERMAANRNSSFTPPPPVAPPKATLPRASKRRPESDYLIKLDGPFSTPEQIQAAAGLPAAPPLLNGTGTDGDAARFCRITQTCKLTLEAFLSTHYCSHGRPLFIRLPEAAKRLDAHSPSPTLGWDPTLPHRRPDADRGGERVWYRPRQDEYPVWYFFYGTLADPGKLVELDIFDPEGAMPALHPARVRDGVLRTWGKGAYKALVDGPGGVVMGSAYRVRWREQEDALRCYETEHYEVVRVRIWIEGEGEGEGEEVWGCTFRFVDAELLD